MYFQLEFLKDVKCAKACVKTYTGGYPTSEKKLQLLRKGMAMNYQHHWIVGRVSQNIDQIHWKCIFINYHYVWMTLYILFLLDNMPVTWCYQLEDERQYCSTGFPMGCYSKESRSQQDTCTIHVSTELKILSCSYTWVQSSNFIIKEGFVNEYFCIHIQGPYTKSNTYYLFNHVNLTITYHSGATEEWGSGFKENGGRIICEYFCIYQN